MLLGLAFARITFSSIHLEARASAGQRESGRH
jgi:hypothetical protein